MFLLRGVIRTASTRHAGADRMNIVAFSGAPLRDQDHETNRFVYCRGAAWFGGAPRLQAYGVFDRRAAGDAYRSAVNAIS